MVRCEPNIELRIPPACDDCTDQPNNSMEPQENAATTSPSVSIPEDSNEAHPSGRRVRRIAGGLAHDRVSFRIPTNEDAKIHVHDTHGPESWRAKILHFLHRPLVQWTLIGLLLLDVVILFIEIFLGAHYPMCSYVTRDAISCCPPTDGAATYHSNIRSLAEDSHGSFCQAPLVDSNYAAECDPHKWETVHNVEFALFIMTMTILSIFVVEISLLMVALTVCVFFRHFWYVFDLIIVVVSIVLEAWFHVASNDTASALSGLVVIGRCWRFVRVGHGLISATAEITSLKYEEIINLSEELEKLLEEYDEKFSQRDECSETDFEVLREKKNTLLKHHHRPMMS